MRRTRPTRIDICCGLISKQCRGGYLKHQVLGREGSRKHSNLIDTWAWPKCCGCDGASFCLPERNSPRRRSRKEKEEGSSGTCGYAWPAERVAGNAATDYAGNSDTTYLRLISLFFPPLLLLPLFQIKRAAFKASKFLRLFDACHSAIFLILDPHLSDSMDVDSLRSKFMQINILSSSALLNPNNSV